ncbi:MAG: hypothetical protein QG608_2639 [Actinomycetota bacterium]|nr:hypothetical protein [Actinomycetota bacterium]
MRADVGDITVRTVPTDRPVRLTTTSHGLWGSARLNHSLTGGRLLVTVDRPGPAWAPGRADLDLELPSGTALDLSTHRGSIILVTPDGTVRATTGAGDIRLRGARCRMADLSSDDGDIGAGFALPPRDLQVSTAHGDVEVTLPDDGTPYRVRAVAGRGRARIDVPRFEGAGRLVQARSRSGNVQVLCKGSRAAR